MKTVTVELTDRELTLIRVACMQRLDRLGLQPVSYGETRELLNGKLWNAVQVINGKVKP